MFQTIAHKCCGAVYAACRSENKHERHWQKEVLAAAKKGDKIEMSDTVKWGKCTCFASPIIEEVHDPAQLSLF